MIPKYYSKWEREGHAVATIMLCDDASFMRMTLLKIVEPAGHKVIGQAENGAEAIKLYKELKPEIVLMDITMPEVDGIEATKKIKEYDPDAKVIMVSAMGQMVKVCEAIDAGAKDFVVKPFDPDKILQCIDKIL